MCDRGLAPDEKPCNHQDASSPALEQLFSEEYRGERLIPSIGWRLATPSN